MDTHHNHIGALIHYGTLLANSNQREKALKYFKHAVHLDST